MKILLVEDEFEIANFLIRGLKNEGHETIHITDGKEALDAILNRNFDLVILDLMLPSMHGADIVKEARMQQKTVPIIVLTIIQDTESKTKLFNLGVDDYLVKPFSFVELVARIGSVTRRANHPAKEEPQEIVVNDIKIIPKMRAALRNNKPIKLRLKEYELLKYLMEHPNEVINRDTLVEKIWDYNARILSNTVDSHVSVLRKKINKGFKNKMIETIHGVGYILRQE